MEESISTPPFHPQAIESSSQDLFFTPDEASGHDEDSCPSDTNSSGEESFFLTQNSLQDSDPISPSARSLCSQSSGSESCASELDHTTIEEVNPALQARLLRHNFAEFPLQGRLWTCFRQEGWIHNSNGTYSAPLIPGQSERLLFGTELDTRRKLDFFVVPYVNNTLQLPPSSMTNEAKVPLSDEENKYTSILRENLIKRIFCMRDEGKHKGGGTTDPVAPDGTGISGAQSKAAHPDPRASLRRSTRTKAIPGKENRSQEATVTTFEKGADLFIRRTRGNKKRPRTTRSKDAPPLSARHDDEQSLSEEISKLPFPTRSECVLLCNDSPIESTLRREEEYSRSFPKWKFLLSTKHSLLLYGVGSKREILESFSTHELEGEGCVLMIDGYDHDADIDILLDVVEDCFSGDEEASDGRPPHDSDDGRMIGTAAPSRLGSDSMVHRAARISRRLANRSRKDGQPLYLVINNIDGPAFRNRHAQEAIAALVINSGLGHGVCGVRLVATVDHVNSVSVLWDVETNANFSWIYKEIHTYRPYIDELTKAVVADERRTSSKFRQSKSGKGDTNVLVVLSSLAPRHAQVLQELAKAQLESPTSGPVNLNELRGRCGSAMVTTSDSQLRQFLTELVDHELVEVERTNGREWVRIPHSVDILNNILEYGIKR